MLRHPCVPDPEPWARMTGWPTGAFIELVAARMMASTKADREEQREKAGFEGCWQGFNWEVRCQKCCVRPICTSHSGAQGASRGGARLLAEEQESRKGRFIAGPGKPARPGASETVQEVDVVSEG